MAQLFQRPMRRIRVLSTPALNRAMAPVVRKAPTDIWEGVMLYLAPWRSAWTRRTSVKSFERSITKELVGVGRYEHIGVVGVAPWRRSRMTWSARADTAHARLVPLRPWPMHSPRTPLFWVVKVRVTKVAARSVTKTHPR